MNVDLVETIRNWDLNTSDQTVLNQFLSEAKLIYQSELRKFQLDNSDDIYFAWANKALHLYLIRISNKLDVKRIVVMAVPIGKNDKDKISYFDMSKETDNGIFIHSSKAKQIDLLFTQYGLSDQINPEEVLKSSIFQLYPGFTLKLWINQWIEGEMNHTKEHFSVPPVSLNFNDLGLHPQKFRIDQMVKAVDDKQFSCELYECIAAFEHEYYYPAAAGFGGIMESLLFKTLDNYGHSGSSAITNDPTFSNYISALKQYGLVDHRQESRLRSAFMIRNGVSHYNSGFTEVSDIENMMHGVENIFTSLFLPSQEWKKSHPNQRLPKPGDQKK